MHLWIVLSGSVLYLFGVLICFKFIRFCAICSAVYHVSRSPSLTYGTQTWSLLYIVIFVFTGPVL